MSASYYRKLISLVVLFTIVLQPLAVTGTQVDKATSRQGNKETSRQGIAAPAAGGLYRTTVIVDSPRHRARLEGLGVVVLTEDERRTAKDEGSSSSVVGRSSLVILADADQLEALARLRFEPRATDDADALVAAHTVEKPWLAAAWGEIRQRMATDKRMNIAALVSLSTSSLSTPAMSTALAALSSIDDDGDGLTNTEEAWWCTDPLNPNSDGDADGYTDGQEVAALLDFTLPRNVRWGYGPPFGPPAAWPNFNDRNGTHVNVCNDGDYDTIPDYAEVYMVGTRVPAESTDGDKFDDGQELFGVTFCPGGDASCGYGAYPRVEYWNYIKDTMPTWVLPPGDNPFVAAFPIPEVSVDEGSWKMDRVTTITTQQGQMTEATKTYGSEARKGQRSSVADTRTWNEWEEVSTAIERPLAQAASAAGVAGRKPSFNTVAKRALKATNDIPELSGQNIGSIAGGVICGLTGVGAVAIPLCSLAGAVAGKLLEEPVKNLLGLNKDETQVQVTYNDNSVTQIQQNNFEADPDSESMVGAVSGLQYAIGQQGQAMAQGFHAMSLSMDRQTAVLDRGLANVANAILAPRITETRANGKSWGGAQTVTNEEYEEHALTEQNGFTTGENWSTAWAVDSSRAATLVFTYTIRNTGTEYARELTGLIFNVYLNDELISSYPAWQQFPNGKLENLFPNSAPINIHSNPIALTLDQMKAMDTGGRLRIVVEDYSYGADELFYQNAITGGMTIYIEDGVEDGDENVDMYVIPTWGAESVQEVLTRYFPAGYDADGLLNSLWTPEFSGASPPVFHEHFLSNLEWWNIYSTQPDAADLPLRDLPAEAGQAMLIRMSRDSDRDGYQDRVELRYGTDKDDAASHPNPEILAGYVATRAGNQVTVTLALENSGTFDAYNVQATMYSPDATTTVNDNVVGGNGRVRPGRHVAVGSLIQPPTLSSWSGSTARPYTTGNYTGSDHTFTFTVSNAGAVGAGSAAMTWTDGAGGTGTLDLGGSYHAPLPLTVRDGLQIGFNTGTLAASNWFTVTALSPRDTLRYTINTDPNDPASYTEPVIVVSYNDPHGNTQFVTPVKLAALGQSLAPFSGQMLKPLEFAIRTHAAVTTTAPNQMTLLLNSPHPAPILGSQVYLDFLTDGARVLHLTRTLDVQPGPNLVDVEWSTSQFSQPYDPAKSNILIAHWTDSENNIIDTAARPLNLFLPEAEPTFIMATADETWDFGAVPQGTLLKRSFTFANTGALDLLTYVSAPAGLTVSQTGSRRVGIADMTTYEMALNTASLPVGPYIGDITIRTSDPDARERTVHVSGTVTAAAADTPVGAMQRPLDWPAPVSDTQGQWVEFTHTLRPDPATLHPVKVWSQDYGTLKGVGKYATSFGQGTASYDMFGDGRDGVMPSSGNLDNNNGVGVAIANNGSVGVYSINVTDVYYGWRINPGDVVLIHQTQGTGAGCWELNKAVSDYAGGTADIQLAKPLQCNYASGGNNHAQIQRVPQYTNCPISGTVTPISGWNGTWGGILAVQCNGTMNITGAVNASGYGFRGGCGGVRGSTNGQVGCQGEGTGGSGGRTWPANGAAGGGGEGDYYPNTGCVGHGGGGGSYQGTGGNGGYDREHPHQAQDSTGPGGPDNLSLMFLGSGGGGGGADADSNAPGTAPSGGSGGGIVVLYGRQIQITGAVAANGQGGGNTYNWTGGGGGGGGGAIYIVGAAINRQDNQVQTLGGARGINTNEPNGWEFYGGNGSNGRIHTKYCESVIGATNPSGTQQKLDCYIVEQVESAPYDRARLNLPESGDHTYQVQYGRKLNWGGAANQVTTLRVPAGLFTSVTLQALVSDLSSNAWFALDVGNTGSDSWNGTVGNGGEYISPNLAAFFNAYWVSHGAPTTGYLDVPIRVYLDRAGQVLLTNLQVTPTGSKTRAIRLPVRPQGYSNVAASFTVSDGTSPLAVGVDVGGDGSVDWTYTGSPAYPAALTTGNLAAAANAYLASKPDPVDVPIRFYLAPFATLDLTGFTATPVGQPDASIGAGDVTFGGAVAVQADASRQASPPGAEATGLRNASRSRPAGLAAAPGRFTGLPLRSPTALAPDRLAAPMGAPVEGDIIIINATIHNDGTLDTGPLTASFYAAPTGGTDATPWYIGSAFVDNVTVTGAATVPLQWNTLGFTGTVPIRVIVDLSNRVAESNENNNVVTATINIRTRPDLSIPAIALSDDEPTTDETVTVTVTLQNAGQTTAGTQTIALYDGNPEAGGVIVGADGRPPLPGGATDTISFTWLLPAPGLHRLFVRADRDHQVNEANEGNNDRWLDVYVGFHGPIMLDSGRPETEPTYTPSRGYGVVDEGLADVTGQCGSAAYQSYRRDPGGRVVYRFDDLLPGHFYHLDLTLYECDRVGRQELVKVDSNQVAGPLDLGDALSHTLSLRLDPALYADRTISVSVEAAGMNGAVVNEVWLHDVDYRYADAGGVNDPAYPDRRGYGWLEGTAPTPQPWGTLPYQSVRVNQNDATLHYRFDGLSASKRYRVHLTFYQVSGAAVVQKAQFDAADAGPSFNLVSGQVYSTSLAVPLAAYTDDGRLTVGIVRLGAETGAFVNEIALEEETATSALADCAVTRSPYFCEAYGSITVNGVPAAVGTVVQAITAGDTVGCAIVSDTGAYVLRVFGRDTTTSPPVPGMKDGELVEFRVNGAPTVATPSFYWHDDKAGHTVNLAAGPVEGQSILLEPQNWTLLSFNLEPPVPLVPRVFSSIEGRYDRALGEKGVWAPSLPVTYTTLTELHADLGYWVHITGTSSVNLLVQGLTVPPTTTLALHSGWNWVGYLPVTTQPITTALASIAGSVLRVVGDRGSWQPDLPPQYVTLWDMRPGEGYLIRTSQAVSLTYPTGGTPVAATTPTVRPQSACPPVGRTPYLSLAYGPLLVSGQPAPVGAIVETITPRGEVAGCTMVTTAGYFGVMALYGEDASASPTIPGFRRGEPVTFRVNGRPAVAAPPLIWQDDLEAHQVKLRSEGRQMYLPLIHSQ